MDNAANKIIRKKTIEDSLRQEFEQTIHSRVERCLTVKPHILISDHHFSRVSTECFLLHRDGHYYGCISLTQSVAEALVRLLCDANGWSMCKDYKENVGDLFKRNKITSEQSASFLNIWKNRNDYHHLNFNIERDRIKLQLLAKEKLEHLNKIEKELFSFIERKGKMIPKYPRYWNLSNGKINGYLRID